MNSSEDGDEIRQAIDSLQEVQLKVFEAAYKNQSQSGAGAQQGESAGPEDAEYKEVDDKK